MASEEFRRDGDRAALRETTADIADVLVHAEDLLHHQHHRQLRTTRRPRVVRRQRAVRDRYADLADIEPLRRRDEGLGTHGQCRDGEAARQRSGDETATVERREWSEAAQVVGHRSTSGMSTSLRRMNHGMKGAS